MTFQLWVRALLGDATANNKAHSVAMLGPHTLRELYEHGVAPTIQDIVGHLEGKVPVKAAKVEDRQSDKRRLAKAA